MDKTSQIGTQGAGADNAVNTRTNPEVGLSAANGLPKCGRETFAVCPDSAAPHSKRQGAQSWTSCRRCSVWYAAPVSTLAKGGAVYCSSACAYAHFKETGKFKADKNPNWLGGVSNDNMRYQRRQKEREPIQTAARQAVWVAIRSGKLIRLPCEVCGATKSEGHHDDYDKPLDVRWLCRTHHVEHHKRIA